MSWSAFVMPMWVVIFFRIMSQIYQCSLSYCDSLKRKGKKKLYKKYGGVWLRVEDKILGNFFFLVNPYLISWQGHQCCQHFFSSKIFFFFQKSNFWGNRDSSVILLTPLNFSFCCQSPVTVSWWSWLMAKYMRVVKRALNIVSKTIISCSYFLSTIRS